MRSFARLPPKPVYFLYNSFSLQLTENLHEQKHFLKTFTTCFVYIIFWEIIIKKNHLPPYGPLNICPSCCFHSGSWSRDYDTLRKHCISI